MGHVRHDAVIVTHWDKQTVDALASQAPSTATAVTKAPVNGYWTFVVLTCGSKINWPDFEMFRGKLWQFIELLKHSGAEWAWVTYGHDDEYARVVRDAWTDKEEVEP